MNALVLVSISLTYSAISKNKVTYRKQVFLSFDFIFIEPVEPECSNLKSDVLCNKWSSDGYCTSKWLFWATWMMKNCKKTCNKC